MRLIFRTLDHAALPVPAPEKSAERKRAKGKRKRAGSSCLMEVGAQPVVGEGIAAQQPVVGEGAAAGVEASLAGMDVDDDIVEIPPPGVGAAAGARLYGSFTLLQQDTRTALLSNPMSRLSVEQ